MYTIRNAAGWHNQISAAIITTTDSEDEAALRAGCRADIRMPGGSGKYDAYATDEDGDEIERIESFLCADCGEIVAWGENGPTGTMGGEIMECPGSVESHRVSWVCGKCAENYA